MQDLLMPSMTLGHEEQLPSKTGHHLLHPPKVITIAQVKHHTQHSPINTSNHQSGLKIQKVKVGLQEQVQKPRSGARNKRKGSNAERLYAIRFREFGFDKCITSREGSKLLDDCAVDLMFIPILAQIKAGRQTGMNISKVLKDIKDRIALRFPSDAPEQRMPAIVIHYKDMGFIKGSGERRVRGEYDEIVSMTFDTFAIFLKAYTNDLQSNKRTN